MAEEANDAKEPVAEAPKTETPKTEAPAKDKGTPKGKRGKGLFDLLGLMVKKKGDQAGVKTAPGAKKPSVPMPAVFNPQKINLKTINQVLVAILVALVGLMFYVTFKEKPQISSVLAAISNITLPDIESKPFVEFNDLDYYLNQAKQRDIFSAFEEKKPEPPPKPVVEEKKKSEPPPKPVVPIEEKAKNIKLMGISWGDNPKAMLRDLSTQGIQFVGIGEVIDGTDIKVKDIMKHEVILTSEGQDMSLL